MQMIKDLRYWIKQLDEAGELLSISKTVNVEEKVGSLVYQSMGGKALLFNNIERFPNWRILGTAPTNIKQVGISMNVEEKEVVRRYAELLKKGPSPCKLVENGPVKEVKWLEQEVDLGKIPVNLIWGGDGGLYIGSGLCLVKDPDTGIQNMSFHRLQVKGKNKTGIQARTETHLWKIYQKYERIDQPMPISIFIGHHPLVEYPGNWSGSMDIDELELASTLLGEPLPVVRCETNDLKVPAFAEIVIEGIVPPGIRKEEGPFGEFQGYPNAAKGLNPIVEVKAITMRHDAIYKTLTNYHNPCCNINMAAVLYNRLKEIGGGVDIKDVFISWDLFTAIIQLSPSFLGEAKNVLLATLSGPFLHHKIAIAVDEDVNIYNPEDLMWALSTRVNPAEDVFIVPGTRGHSYDLSLKNVGKPGSSQWQAVGSKMGIDATKPPKLADPDGWSNMMRNYPPASGKFKLEDFID